MSQHSLMYHMCWWDRQPGPGTRIKSVFMAGNFDPMLYTSVEVEGMFNVYSRVTIRNFLNHEERLYEITDPPGLLRFLDQPLDQKVVLLDRRLLDAPMDQLHDILSRVDFFFALLGVVMPFSHNIIEAMSLGCIPLLQETYAQLFSPALTHGKNAITFNTLDDLAEMVECMFNKSDREIEQMRAAVNGYYYTYLTPQAVVRTMEQHSFSRIFLQAEHLSVRLLKAKP